MNASKLHFTDAETCLKTIAKSASTLDEAHGVDCSSGLSVADWVSGAVADANCFGLDMLDKDNGVTRPPTLLYTKLYSRMSTYMQRCSDLSGSGSKAEKLHGSIRLCHR